MSDLIHFVKDSLNTIKPNLEDRLDVTSFLVAQSLSGAFSLPTSAVEDPYKFFRDTHFVALQKAISDVNEEVMVDIEEVESIVLKLWVMRYRLVHDTNNYVVRKFINQLISCDTVNIPEKYRNMIKKYENLNKINIQHYNIEE